MDSAPIRSSGMPPQGFVLRVGAYYGAVFLLIGGFLPYFPVWLDWRGLASAEIGLVLAAPSMVRIAFVPAIAFAADRFGDRRRILLLLGWGAVLSCALLGLATGFWAILLATALFALCWTAVVPLSETVAMAGVRESGFDYGRMRLWGSFTFIGATIGGGFALEAWGPPAAFWLIGLGAVSVAASAYVLPMPTGRGHFKAARAMPRVRLSEALRLARAPLFLLFLATAGSAQATHAVYYAFGTLHWRGLGVSTDVIGLLWTTGVVAEIALFAVSRRAVTAIGPVGLLGLAGAAALLRWSATALDPPLALLFPIQALHGLTFGAAHLGAIHFIAAAVPEDYAGTAQGLYASIAGGMLMGAAMATAGPLYEGLAGGAFAVMAGLGGASLLGAILLARGWRGRHLIAVPLGGDL